MKIKTLIIVFFLLVFPIILQGKEVNKAFGLLNKSNHAYEKINCYQTVFIKRERIDNEIILEELLLKFKKPFSVYVKWIGNNHHSREVIFIQCENNNNLLVKEGGLLNFLTLTIYPKSEMAMAGQRHAIDEIGIGHLISRSIEEIAEAQAKGDIKLEVIENPNEYIIKSNFLNTNYYAKSAKLYINKKNYLITKAIFEDENGIFEDYEFTKLEINPNFTDKDFRF